MQGPQLQQGGSKRDNSIYQNGLALLSKKQKQKGALFGFALVFGQQKQKQKIIHGNYRVDAVILVGKIAKITVNLCDFLIIIKKFL